jgi:hypothetical protein
MKHKHAENMLAYAQDAMETDKPWERWEYYDRIQESWVTTKVSPLWREKNQYRRKPRTININGFEVPEPVRVPLETDTNYYCPHLASSELVSVSTWWDDGCDARRLNSGIIHLTKEAAVTHAKALLSFTQK